MIKPSLKLFPYLLVLYEVMVYLSNDMYIPAVPQLMRDLHIDAHIAQLTLTSWFLGGVSLQLILGPISDCYGRRPVVLCGGIVYILSTILCALSPNAHILLIARFIEGTVQSSVVVAGYAAIHELFETRRAIIILSTMGSVVVLAPAFGPLVGSLVLFVGTWRTIFWLLAIGSILLISLLYRYMPESNKNIGKYILQLRPVLQSYLRIIKSPTFVINTLIFCILFGVFIVWLTGGPFAIIVQLGRANIDFGWSQVFIFGAFMLGSRLVNRFIDFLGLQRMVNWGLMLALLGGILAYLLTFNPTNLYGMVFGLMFFSFGSSLAFGTLNRLAMEGSHEPMGAKMAVFSTAMTGFGAFWSAVVSGLAINTLPMLAKLVLIQIVCACLVMWISQKPS